MWCIGNGFLTKQEISIDEDNSKNIVSDETFQQCCCLYSYSCEKKVEYKKK